MRQQVHLSSVESTHFSGFCMTCGQVWITGALASTEMIEHAAENGHKIRAERMQFEYWQPVDPDPNVDLEAAWHPEVVDDISRCQAVRNGISTQCVLVADHVDYGSPHRWSAMR